MSRFQAVDAQLVALKLARAALLNEVLVYQQIHEAFKDSLCAAFGGRNPLLAQFGLKPRLPRRPLTPEQRLVRAEKALQTRKLRHTMGSRQRAAIRYTGEVTVISELQPLPSPQISLPGPPDAVAAPKAPLASPSAPTPAPDPERSG